MTLKTPVGKMFKCVVCGKKFMFYDSTLVCSAKCDYELRDNPNKYLEG